MGKENDRSTDGLLLGERRGSAAICIVVGRSTGRAKRKPGGGTQRGSPWY